MKYGSPTRCVLCPGVRIFYGEPMADTVNPYQKETVKSPNDLDVSMMKVSLSTGEDFLLYDTAGPYRDPDFKQDSERGIKKLRSKWIVDRAT